MMRGVEPFNQLWTRRTTVEFVPGIPVDPMSQGSRFRRAKMFLAPIGSFERAGFVASAIAERDLARRVARHFSREESC